MLDDIKAKESQRINDVITVLEEQKAGVEEKYRKLAEEETAKLNAAIESYKNLLSFWDGANIETVEKPRRKRRTKAEMEAAKQVELPEDEKVVDTIIPENNEESVVEENSEDMPESVDEPEFDGAGFTSEDNKEPETVEITDNAEETVEAWEGDDKPAKEESDDENWPDYPSEWK